MQNVTLAFQHTSMEVLALRSVISIRKKYQCIKISLKMSISIFPIHNTSIRRVMFRVMKLGRYVIVDDGGKYVMFHELNIHIKITKNNKSSQRELRPSVFQCDKFVQICLLLAHPSFRSRNDPKLPKP